LAGEPVAIAALRDITTRQRAEEEAHKARIRLEAILASAPSYVFAVDTEGRLIFINRTINIQRDDYLGVSMFQLIEPSEQSRVKAIFTRVIETKQPATYEIAVSGANGSAMWFENYMSPIIQDNEVIGAIVVSQDTTEKKQLEARLLTSERMASMGLLAAGVAHEINNPLTAIVASLELASILMSDPPANATEIKALLQETSDSIDRVRFIVQDLRVFSRAEDDSRSAVRLRPILESMLRMAQNEIRHRARLFTNYGAAPLVKANESRLGQVFLNLIMNAVQAIAEGHAEDNELRVVVNTAKTGEAVIEISDTGCGMSPEVKQRIFEPFFTTKPAGVGTGLGLPICSRFIADFGGRIEVESAIGKGTTFRVYLPASEEAPSAPQILSQIQPPQRREKILVLDDEVSIGTALRRLLSSDYEVSFLSNAAEALRVIREGERFGVILCDVMMAEMNGVEFFHELQRVAPSQAERIIFMTGGAFTPQTRNFLYEINRPHLEKPFDSRTLRALLSKTLSKTSTS
jgi:PAS domain S-box-containing protein